MKILFPIGSYFPAQGGGPDNTLHWLISEIIKESGLQITVASTLYGIDNALQNQFSIVPNQPRLFDKNYSVIYFELNSRKTYSPSLMKWLFKEISKFDLVFITSFFNHHSMLSAFLCRLKNVPFIISPRGELRENAFKYANKSRILKLIYLQLFKFFNSKVFFHATSNEEYQSIKNYFPKADIRILPNLIPVNNEPDFSIHRKGILYLGRLNPIKGIENLIDAYNSLPVGIKAEHPLIIAGDGKKEYITALEKKIKSYGIEGNVIFKGHVTGEEKTELYSRAKVFVLPSYSENFANVILEAITNGLYVITSIHTPWKELADNNIGSWINNDPVSISKEILKILKLDINQYSDITRKAFNQIKDRYDVKRNISLYKDYILDAAKKAN